MEFDKIVIRRNGFTTKIELVEESTVDNVPDSVIRTFETTDETIATGFLLAKITDIGA